MSLLALPLKAGRLPAERHPAAVYVTRLSPGSRRTMRGALDTVADILSSGRLNAETLDWSKLRFQHTAAVRAVVAKRYAPATANKVLAALRGVLREAWRLGLMSAEDYQRAADIEAVKGSTLPAGRALGAGELRALFSACARDRNHVAGARDAAVLALLYGAGLRRSEVVALTLSDYDVNVGALTIRRPKGNRDRIAYATNGSADALADWIERRGNEDGALFCPVDKAGRVAVRHMTTQAIFNTCRARAAEAGVQGFSPHDLRRSYVGDLLDAGADISVVQRLAGHANVATTARYDRRGEVAKRKAADLLHVPYRRPHKD